MSANILIITATCRTEGCEQNGVPHVFERESDVDANTTCGQCQVIITDLKVSEA